MIQSRWIQQHPKSEPARIAPDSFSKLQALRVFLSSPRSPCEQSPHQFPVRCLVFGIDQPPNPGLHVWSIVHPVENCVDSLPALLHQLVQLFGRQSVEICCSWIVFEFVQPRVSGWNDCSDIICWAHTVQLNQFDVSPFRIALPSKQNSVTGRCMQPRPAGIDQSNTKFARVSRQTITEVAMSPRIVILIA